MVAEAGDGFVACDVEIDEDGKVGAEEAVG